MRLVVSPKLFLFTHYFIQQDLAKYLKSSSMLPICGINMAKPFPLPTKEVQTLQSHCQRKKIIAK